jgi:hypothetical protein
MVIVTLVIEAFEHVTRVPFLDYENVFLEIIPFAFFNVGG